MERRDLYVEGDVLTPQEETRKRVQRSRLLFQTEARLIGKSDKKKQKTLELSRK